MIKMNRFSYCRSRLSFPSESSCSNWNDFAGLNRDSGIFVRTDSNRSFGSNPRRSYSNEDVYRIINANRTGCNSSHVDHFNLTLDIIIIIITFFYMGLL